MKEIKTIDVAGRIGICHPSSNEVPVYLCDSCENRNRVLIAKNENEQKAFYRKGDILFESRAFVKWDFLHVSNQFTYQCINGHWHWFDIETGNNKFLGRKVIDYFFLAENEVTKTLSYIEDNTFKQERVESCKYVRIRIEDRQQCGVDVFFDDRREFWYYDLLKLKKCVVTG